MQVKTKGVGGGGMIISCATVLVSRALAESNLAVPNGERIESARVRFEMVGMPGARLLIEAIQLLEDKDHVVGYFGFTIDRDGLTRTPLSEGETESERGMKIMRLPHPQWGHRSGRITVVGDLVTLAEQPMLASILPEKVLLLDRMFCEAATFFARGSSEGES